MKLTVFTDFDGTVTKVDTVAAMVESFSGEGWEEINKLWEQKQISTEECARRTLRLFRATPEDIARLLDSVEIDQYFPSFLDFCRKRNFGVYVLSDGYDFNIEKVFNKHGIRLPYYANRIYYDGGFGISCPFTNPECGNCGTCKTKLMERLREEGSLAVYIGDGYSDTCPAGRADLVFARDALYEYCLKNGITAVPFRNFGEIMACLDRLSSDPASMKERRKVADG